MESQIILSKSSLIANCFNSLYHRSCLAVLKVAIEIQSAYILLPSSCDGLVLFTVYILLQASCVKKSWISATRT